MSNKKKRNFTMRLLVLIDKKIINITDNVWNVDKDLSIKLLDYR